MLDGPLGQLQSMLEIKCFAVTRCSIDFLLHRRAIIWVNSREDKFHRRFRSWIALKDSERLVGPEDLAAGNLPPEATCVTQLLRFGQVGFASPDGFFRNLTFRDVDDRSHNLVVACFVSHAMCEIVKMLDRTVWHQQPMLVIKIISAVRRSLERVCDKAHIVRMGALQNQIGRRFRSGRVPVNPRRLLGPKYPPRACFHSDEASATESLRLG